MTDDERREEYEGLILGAFNEETEEIDTYDASLAVIARADEEIARLRDLLKAEAKRAKDAIDREHQADRFADEVHSELESVVEENHILCAELRESQRLLEANRTAASEAEEIIERVRAVLDDIDETDRVKDLSRVLRSALEGYSDD